jgi:hypothetical protein
MGKVLGIIYRAIATHLVHKAGLQLNRGAPELGCHVNHLYGAGLAATNPKFLYVSTLDS